MTPGIRCRWRVALAALAIVAVQFSVLGAPGPLAQAEDPVDGNGDPGDGTRISVVVVESSPKASSTTSAPPFGNPKPSNGGRPSKEPKPPKSPKATDSATPLPEDSTPTDEISIGGLLYVSGLSGETRLALDPLANSHTVRFSVRNASRATVDARATFHLINVLGQQIGPGMGVDVEDLKPDEVRVVAASMGGLGQWTLVRAVATFVPPEKIGDTELAPLERDQWVFFPPWYLLGGGALVGAAIWFAPTLTRRLRAGALGAVGSPA
ncbi:hypothetical protein LKO27_12265 [Tessaracoccus sp. OS52]|uniref:hypothetical protein n=1 Tax=Tessaracoccus sp. OS52 TaxID=2886691 RepID=UPI001D11D6D2|nr:hypothetical protein [Tessaracoccus sp. OS52]MCC2594181.1 hypothetical protein [Tessaracoccus sp. OS52]